MEEDTMFVAMENGVLVTVHPIFATQKQWQELVDWLTDATDESDPRDHVAQMFIDHVVSQITPKEQEISHEQAQEPPARKERSALQGAVPHNLPEQAPSHNALLW